jgi:hypothetical protein
MSRTSISCKATGGDVIYEGERFWCKTPEEVKATLREHGVAVLLDAVDADGVQKLQDGMWDTLGWMTQHMETPVVRGDPTTYGSVRELAPTHGFLFQGWRGLAHRQHVWDARETAAPAFAAIWGCAPEDLLCSFDAVSMGIVHMAEPKATGWERGNVWLHMDQAPARPDFECVQAWLTGEDILPGNATLDVMPGSHKLMARFAAENGVTETKDWYKLSAEERAWYQANGCERLRILAPAGALVLWDSRTIHSGANPLKEAPVQKPRNVVYICMQPRHVTVRGMDLGTEKRRLTRAETKALETTLKKRRMIFDPTNESRFLRMTTHWPRPVRLFGAFPRSYGPKPDSWAKVPTGEMPKLTALQRRLAGLDD